MVFYYVHPVALYINKFIVAKLLDAPLSEDGYYEQIFETGVDEMSWDDLSKNEMEVSPPCYAAPPSLTLNPVALHSRLRRVQKEGLPSHSKNHRDPPWYA